MVVVHSLAGNSDLLVVDYIADNPGLLAAVDTLVDNNSGTGCLAAIEQQELGTDMTVVVGSNLDMAVVGIDMDMVVVRNLDTL